MRFTTYKGRLAGRRALERDTWYASEYLEEHVKKLGVVHTRILHVFRTHLERSAFVDQTWTPNHYARRVTKKDATRNMWSRIINH